MEMTAKFDGNCRNCGGILHAGDRIDYDYTNRAAAHLTTCPLATEYDMTRKMLHRAANLLAGRCDGARSWDGAGFSKFDANFGWNLAEKNWQNWTPKMTAAAYKMLRKYRKQLATCGLEFSEIPAL